MATIEQCLSEEQKASLEDARRILGLRSRAAVFRWFADNAAEIARGQLTGPGIIGVAEPQADYVGREEKSR